MSTKHLLPFIIGAAGGLILSWINPLDAAPAPAPYPPQGRIKIVEYDVPNGYAIVVLRDQQTGHEYLAYNRGLTLLQK